MGDKSAITTDIVVSFVIGLIFLGIFAWWETHTAEPMIDVRVFRNARFSAASAVLTLTSFALYGSLYLLTQYFQFVLGYSPFEAGLLALPVAVGMMATSPNAPKLVFRWGTKWVVVVGSLVIAGTMVLYASNTIMSSFVGGCVVRLFFGIGLGLTSAPATESIMGSLPPSRAGVGSAINDTTRQTGGALGIAVIGSLFLTTYHHYADKTKGLSAASSAALHDSVGKAIDLARTLPQKQGDALIELSQRGVHRGDARHVSDRRRVHRVRRVRGVEVAPRGRQRRRRRRAPQRRDPRDQRVRDPRHMNQSVESAALAQRVARVT